MSPVTLIIHYSFFLGLKINIGLWKACVRLTKDGDFECRDYSSDKSPYNGKALDMYFVM